MSECGTCKGTGTILVKRIYNQEDVRTQERNCPDCRNGRETTPAESAAAGEPAGDALRDARPPKEPKRYTLSEINPGWRCPDCDGTEVISSGPQRFICDRCFLTAKLDTAEARTVSLEAQLADARSQLAIRYSGMCAVSKLEARNGKLVEALTRYGKHDFQCCRNNWITRANAPTCTCGLTDALEVK